MTLDRTLDSGPTGGSFHQWFFSLPFFPLKATIAIKLNVIKKRSNFVGTNPHWQGSLNVTGTATRWPRRRGVRAGRQRVATPPVPSCRAAAGHGGAKRSQWALALVSRPVKKARGVGRTGVRQCSRVYRSTPRYLRYAGSSQQVKAQVPGEVRAQQPRQGETLQPKTLQRGARSVCAWGAVVWV